MNSINLLPKELQVNKKLLLIKHWAILTTSIVLVVYVVGAAGILGWWFYLATQDGMTTKSITAAEAQIRQVSSTEALVRETGKREELIQTFLSSRVDVASLTATLVPVESVSVDSYKYSAGSQTISIHVTDLGEMEKYTERLKSIYPNILNSTVANSNDGQWNIQIKL